MWYKELLFNLFVICFTGNLYDLVTIELIKTRVANIKTVEDYRYVVFNKTIVQFKVTCNKFKSIDSDMYIIPYKPSKNFAHTASIFK